MAEQTTERTSKQASFDTLIALGMLVAFLLLIIGEPSYIIWTLTPDSIKYSIVYRLKTDQVHADPRPKDCDWDHAPLGGKGCHYRKDVATVRSRDAVTDVYVTWQRIPD